MLIDWNIIRHIRCIAITVTTIITSIIIYTTANVIIYRTASIIAIIIQRWSTSYQFASIIFASTGRNIFSNCYFVCGIVEKENRKSLAKV